MNISDVPIPCISWRSIESEPPRIIYEDIWRIKPAAYVTFGDYIEWIDMSLNHQCVHEADGLPRLAVAGYGEWPIDVEWGEHPGQYTIKFCPA